MKKLIYILSLSCLFLIGLIGINSCSKDDVTTVPTDNAEATICGVVVDENNTALSGVSVNVYGQLATSNEEGIFVLKSIPINKSRCIMKFSRAGFFSKTHAFIPSPHITNYVRIVLVDNVPIASISSSSGGIVSLTNGSSVEFQPNSFVTASGSPYSGMVNVTIQHLAPGNPNFGFSIPGNDLAAKDAAGNEVALVTYGMLGIELKGSSGESLQLAAGNTATLTFAIPLSMIANAPATIPLWYFDEATAFWKEEGAATRNGIFYVGTVAHFTWWNCDFPGGRATIKGRVIDCNHVPLANVVVTINGFTLLTDQNGVYSNWVPDAIALTAQVTSADNDGFVLSSQLENIPALSAGQYYNIPDLITCTSRIAGTLLTCSGEATDGFISVVCNNISHFEYTSNGSFSEIVIPNNPFVFFAYNRDYTRTYIHNATSGAPGTVVNLNDINLCMEIALNNSMHISNCSLIEDTTISMAPVNMTGRVELSSTVLSFSFGSNCGFQLGFEGTMPDNYNWNGNNSYNYISLSIDNKYSVQTLPGVTGTIQVLSIGTIGDFITGTYEGTALFTKFGNPIVSVPADISGSFKVIRTQ